MSDTIPATLFNEIRRKEGLPEMPTRWEVCSTCNGEGAPDHRVFTQADFYTRVGFENYAAHRRICETCDGRTTIKAAHIGAATAETATAWLEYVREQAGR